MPYKHNPRRRSEGNPVAQCLGVCAALTALLGVSAILAQERPDVPGSKPTLRQPFTTITGRTVTNPTQTLAPETGQLTPSPPTFLFELEKQLGSLKTVPIWNELEAMLDFPYRMRVDPSTPGIEAIYPYGEWPAYRRTDARGRPAFGSPLPSLLVFPLNYNPLSGEQMRLVNPHFAGADHYAWERPDYEAPYTLTPDVPGLPGTGHPADLFRFDYAVSAGADRIEEGTFRGELISYNSPVLPDSSVYPAIPNGDPGEPGFPRRPRSVPNLLQFMTSVGDDYYTVPAVRTPPGTATPVLGLTQRTSLRDPFTGEPIVNRNVAGEHLKKPSIKGDDPADAATFNIPQYLVNTDPENVTPSSENDYIRNRTIAAALGKAFFWDMQVGSDGVQSCGTCHFIAGVDSRVKNQVNPNHLGGDVTFALRQPNESLTPDDFPFHKVKDVTGVALPAPGVFVAAVDNRPTGGGTNQGMAGDDPANIISDVNDVASSMGVHFGRFANIAPMGTNAPAAVLGVAPTSPDIRFPIDFSDPLTFDPIPGFSGATGNEFRRVEPRNTPTMIAAAFNFDNFWDGRARHDFNGGSVFGASDPQPHVWVNNGTTAGPLTPTRRMIRFASIASLATGPGLSEFEMSFQGRPWAKIAKKLLQSGAVPLGNQIVAPTDSVLGPWSGQRSTVGGPVDRPGRPGLNVSYRTLIQQAFYSHLWANRTQHFNGLYTDGIAGHPQAPAGTEPDPFDSFVLFLAGGAAQPANTDQFTHMEANFALFWGLAINAWVTILVPDDTPFDQFMDANPDAFTSIGEANETGLVPDLRTRRTGAAVGSRPAPVYNGFQEVGNFKRDSLAAHGGTQLRGVDANGAAFTTVGTRQAGAPDPLLGMDLFQGSNLSLKNPDFKAARCGECHLGPNLTDHTVDVTQATTLGDFGPELQAPGLPLPFGFETLGRLRTVPGYLLESELNEVGQDAVEIRMINQSVMSTLNPAASNVYLSYPSGTAYFDNGIYNLGVRPIDEDLGRGGDDPFGWPLSLAALALKNLGGEGFEPGTEMTTFDPALGPGGGLFEISAQDQRLNPGLSGEPAVPQLPPHLAPFVNNLPVGEFAPESDELIGGVNTYEEFFQLEGWADLAAVLNPAHSIGEVYNSSYNALTGTWPEVNRVGRNGSFKAPQLRNVELTGPFMHNGGMLTLRQVIDFYSRGGDFPNTNAAHRDFNVINLNFDGQAMLTEDEKVALVDFLLELTDERVAFERAPYDHPEVFVPMDGLAPENTGGRPQDFIAASVDQDANGGLTAATTAGAMFVRVPAVGAAGRANRLIPFMNVTTQRLSGQAAYNTKGSHYSH